MEDSQQKKSQGSRSPAKRKIRNYLIDREFQLKWMFRVIVVITVIVTFMGWFLYQTIADSTDQMLAAQMADAELTDASMEAFVAQAHKDKMVTIYKLAALLITLVVFMSLATIALTHKIAGPIYKMRKIFGTINGDNLRLWERLRKGDELKEAFEDFDDMLRRLREARREDIKSLEKMKETMGRTDSNQELVGMVEKIVEKYKNSVKMN